MARKIMMIKDGLGSSNEMGSDTRLYKRDETLSLDHPWQVKLAEGFLGLGWAIEHTEVDIETKDEGSGSESGELKNSAKKKHGFITKIAKKTS